MKGPAITRRDFLKTSGGLVVSFSLSGPLALALSRAAQAGAAGILPGEVDSWLEVAPDGAVTVYTGKVDLGTGVRTAMAQMAAEELGVPLERVTMVQGDTAVCPDQGGTWGSLSIQVGGVQVRQAAATAREALLHRGAKQLGAAVDQCVVENGAVRLKDDASKQVTFATLVGGKPIGIPVDPKAPLKDPKSYTIVGKSIPKVELAAKLTGEFEYMQDVRMPDMVHARVVRPPALGSELLEVDESSVRDIPGVIQVVRKGRFLAVVAKNEWAAIRGARALKARWSQWVELPEQASLFEHVRASEIAEDKVLENVGDSAAALRGATKRLSTTYTFPIQTHGSIGPSCAVARVKDGKAVVHTASQAPHFTQTQIAGYLGMDKADVHVVYHDGAGCYGRNGHEDAALDAALVSQLTGGKAVRVQWSREDEHGWDPKGPPTLTDMRAGVDYRGRVMAWEAEIWAPIQAGGLPHLIGAEHAGIAFKPSINPGQVHQNGNAPYRFANAHSVIHRLSKTPFRPSWLRSPGRLQNTFANESFMDELAFEAGADPIDYRLQYLTHDPRGMAALLAVKRRYGWDPRMAASGIDRNASVSRGRGVSYVRYDNDRTYVAMVADVEVDRATGEVRCERFVVAHDCGLIINPDGVMAQIEGNIIQTVSRTMKEEVTFDRSMVTSLDWKSYPILTFPELPKIEAELIDRPDQPPWGVGEPANVVVPSAIANAIFDATGVRLRDVPFRPDRVKAALEAYG